MAAGCIAQTFAIAPWKNLLTNFVNPSPLLSPAVAQNSVTRAGHGVRFCAVSSGDWNRSGLATVLPSWKLSAMHIQLISLSHKERNKANNIFLLLGYCIFSCLVHRMWTMVTLFLLAFTFVFEVKVCWSGAQMLLSWFTAFLAKQVYFSFVYSQLLIFPGRREWQNKKW